MSLRPPNIIMDMVERFYLDMNSSSPTGILVDLPFVHLGLVFKLFGALRGGNGT